MRVKWHCGQYPSLLRGRSEDSDLTSGVEGDVPGGEGGGSLVTGQYELHGCQVTLLPSVILWNTTLGQQTEINNWELRTDRAISQDRTPLELLGRLLGGVPVMCLAVPSIVCSLLSQDWAVYKTLYNSKYQTYLCLIVYSNYRIFYQVKPIIIEGRTVKLQIKS